MPLHRDFMGWFSFGPLELANISSWRVPKVLEILTVKRFIRIRQTGGFCMKHLNDSHLSDQRSTKRTICIIRLSFGTKALFTLCLFGNTLNVYWECVTRSKSPWNPFSRGNRSSHLLLFQSSFTNTPHQFRRNTWSQRIFKWEQF